MTPFTIEEKQLLRTALFEKELEHQIRADEASYNMNRMTDLQSSDYQLLKERHQSIIEKCATLRAKI